MEHYTEKLRDLKIQNPTLRDCFDPFCSEYNDSTFEEKIETLRKVISNGFSLHNIAKDYCKYYLDNSKEYVAKDLKSGLTALIDNLIATFTKQKFSYSSYEIPNETLIDLLIAQLKDNSKLAFETKQLLYQQLVAKRRKYDFKDEGIFNPSQLEIKNDEHLNSWAYWHGDLDAKILVIGQDFGGADYYKQYDGLDQTANQTNKNLETLFAELGIKIGTPKNPIKEEKLYFTNAVLGAKNDQMNGSIKRSWYKETATKFTKPLIELIKPTVIIAMGASAYDVLSIIYKLPKKTMKEIMVNNHIKIENNLSIFIVAHCSSLGIANRKFELQKNDWSVLGRTI